MCRCLNITVCFLLDVNNEDMTMVRVRVMLVTSSRTSGWSFMIVSTLNTVIQYCLN